MFDLAQCTKVHDLVQFGKSPNDERHEPETRAGGRRCQADHALQKVRHITPLRNPLLSGHSSLELAALVFQCAAEQCTHSPQMKHAQHRRLDPCPLETARQ